jgi:ribonuclease Z
LARDLGVPGGDNTTLHRGFALDLGDKVIIKPSQVMSAHTHGAAFIIIEVPDVTYIQGVINSAAFAPHYHGTGPYINIDCVVHVLGDKEVLKDSDYLQWCNLFGPRTKHVVLCKGVSRDSITFRASATSLARLTLLDGNIFKVPYYCNDLVGGDILPEGFIVPKLMLHVNLEPKLEIDETDVREDFDHIAPEGKCVKGLERLGDYLEACKAVVTLREAAPAVETPPTLSDRVCVTTLGTACRSQFNCRLLLYPRVIETYLALRFISLITVMRSWTVARERMDSCFVNSDRKSLVQSSWRKLNSCLSRICMRITISVLSNS